MPLDGPPSGEGWSPDTARVPDASRITPPVLKPGFRTGHDIGLGVRLEAGVPIRDLRVTSHPSDVQRAGPAQAAIRLSPAASIPNKDFVLRYAVAGQKPEVALLTHAPRGDDGYFLLMVQPRQMEDELGEAPPREICFLVDVSGSMSGAPTAKVKETMRLLLGRVRPQDHIQVVTFAGQAQRLFPAYQPATPEHIERALSFTDSFRGAGGTDMLSGMRAVLNDPVEEDHVRIVLLLTDGFIGNEDEIVREVRRRAGDQIRFWAVGIGSAPNRHLIDGVGRQGGMSATLGLSEDPAPLVARVSDRMQRAQLGQIELDWGPHAVYETYPTAIPDLWSGSPVVVVGRFRTRGAGTLHVNGRAEGRGVSFPLEIDFPPSAGAHAVLAKVWARRKIEDLSEQMVVAGDALEEEITELALKYRLASAYTSFVAVDESEQARLLAAPRPPRRVTVPVPLPEGVRYEGIFGEREGAKVQEITTIARSLRRAPLTLEAALPPDAQVAALDLAAAGFDAGVPVGVGAGVMGGVVGGMPVAPTPMPKSRALRAPSRPSAAAQAREEYSLAFDAPPPPGPPPQPDPTRHENAVKELERARERVAAKDWMAARRALQRAWLSEEAFFRTSPWSDDGTRGAITREWQALEAGHAAAMEAAQPKLARPLDLVIRNEELAAALASVAKAAGLALRIVPGSLEDARELQQRPSLRVAYLDLRRATPAQALVWLLGPAGLEWTVEGETVIVRSARRGPGTAAWLYRIDDLVQKRDVSVNQALETLTVSLHATRPDPLRLLVDGDRPAHARAAETLAALRRGSEESRRQAMRQQAHVWARAALRTGSWALLASALAGEVDDEAVSELREAWRTPALAEALVQDGEPITLAARTTWAIATARRVRPADAALHALAREGHAVMADVLARRATMAGPLAPPEAELYLALLQRAADLPDALRTRLPAPERVLERAPDALRPVAASLLKAPEPAAIHAAFENHALRGDDAAVLGAWALRAAGASAWSRFRASKTNWLAGARASGGARLVVNRLDASRLLDPQPPGPVARVPAPSEGRSRMGLAAAGLGVGLATVGLACRRRRPPA